MSPWKMNRVLFLVSTAACWWTHACEDIIHNPHFVHVLPHQNAASSNYYHAVIENALAGWIEVDRLQSEGHYRFAIEPTSAYRVRWKLNTTQNHRLHHIEYLYDWLDPDPILMDARLGQPGDRLCFAPNVTVTKIHPKAPFHPHFYPPHKLHQFVEAVRGSAWPKDAPDDRPYIMWLWRSPGKERYFGSWEMLLDRLRPSVENAFRVDAFRAEEFSAKELFVVMASTAVLIGVHGAGLTNMMWMRPGSVVVEIRYPPNLQEPRSQLYEILANRLGHTYVQIDMKHLTLEEFSNENAAPQSDMDTIYTAIMKVIEIPSQLTLSQNNSGTMIGISVRVVPLLVAVGCLLAWRRRLPHPSDALPKRN